MTESSGTNTRMIRIHNSMTGEKEPLEPIVPGEIRMYVCGITVYDFIHVGHARMLTVFDVVSRYLRYRGFKVTYVRNITDIDDKIIQRAARGGEPVEAVTERYIRAMDEDAAQLGLAKPDAEPRATHYVAEIIAMIESLLARGYAYVAVNGDVLYAVSKFEAYGRLSGKRLADLRAGARVEVEEAKRDPLDFVLWKRAKPGEPQWRSPWGGGRPGWHIECSAMSTALLGTRFDVHGGGVDLKFPHHENEIAQSCGATGERFAQLWMHNGFVNVGDEKMSKSLGNFFTVRDVLTHLRHPEVLRYFVLASHYRGPINYSIAALENADAALGRIYNALLDAPVPDATPPAPLAEPTPGSHTQRFQEAMDDDFNTPEALAVLLGIAREINSAKAAGRADEVAARAAELRALGGVLGLGRLEPAEWARLGNPLATLTGTPDGGVSAAGHLADAEVEKRIEGRHEARRAKNWQESDRIRAELAAAGVILEDKSDGTTRWRRA